MTTHAVNSRLHGTDIPGAGLFRKIVAFAAAYGRAMDAQQVYFRLSGMSDRELAARGLTREDIPQFVATRFL